MFAHPPACHCSLPLCLKLTLLAAILRQQKAEKIMKNKYNNTMLFTNIFINVHWFKFFAKYPTPINTFHMLFIIEKQAGSLFISILNNNTIFWECI